MSWIYENKIINELPDDVTGFIYLITNNSNGKRYIGKKLAKFSKISIKTVQLKNGKKKKQKIRSKIDSDWKTYWSSSESLKEDVLSLGESNFSREIIKFCYSKNELSYYEAKFQFDYDVLLNSSQWYNRWISCKVRTLK